jgi:hypothetical protein
MKCKTTCYVSECDTCRKVKADYMKPGGLLQPLTILDWKWEDISMGFILGLPPTTRKVDSIWVIVDHFTKSAYFILVHTRFTTEKNVEIYIAHILCLHGVPKMIVSNRGSRFIALFWEQLHASLRTHLVHSSAYHPQTNGQTKRVNQIFEDMLRAYVVENQGGRDKNLPWAEFSYNNSYQESLKMAPFEALYGRRCHIPLNWIKPGEKTIFGPDLIDEAEATVCHIQDNLKAARSRQESYANKRHRPLEFEVGDQIYLSVSPMKCMKRFGMK